MKALLVILLLVAAWWSTRTLIRHYDKSAAPGRVMVEEPAAPTGPVVLPGLPAAYEASFETAKKQGAPALEVWLKKHRALVTDPRLADIELDYAVLLRTTNPQKARQIFAAVSQRTPTNSPVQPRLRLLQRTFQ